jgi:hypothetical protein
MLDKHLGVFSNHTKVFKLIYIHYETPSIHGSLVRVLLETLIFHGYAWVLGTSTF